MLCGVVFVEFVVCCVCVWYLVLSCRCCVIVCFVYCCFVWCAALCVVGRFVVCVVGHACVVL